MKTSILMVILLFGLHDIVFSQYDFVEKVILYKTNPVNAHKLQYVFSPIKDANPHVSRKQRIYEYQDHNFKLNYYESLDPDSCDGFSLWGQKFTLNSIDSNGPIACRLDVNSFNVFTFKFADKEYLVIQSIRLASGNATSVIIFSFFDITNRERIQYYCLWSFYGSMLCFSDFNHDGKLDFLKIREDWRTSGSDTFKATIETLAERENRFVNVASDRYIIFKRDYSENNDIQIKVLKRKWY